MVWQRRLCVEAYEGGCREICLAMRGEPLINKKLEDYIRYAHELGYTYVFINTNGYFLDESRSKSLLDAGLDSIKVSVNAAEKYYELIHGIDAYDKVKNNVIMFDKYRKEKNSSCKLYISYVAIKQTKEESKTVIKDFEGTLCYNCLFHKNATVIPVNSEATVYVDDKRKKEELNDRIIQFL